MTTRLDGTITRVNASLLAWIGRERAFVLGDRIQALITPAARIFYETHCAPILRAEGTLRQVALDFACPDGRRLPTLIDWRLVTDAGGRPLGYRLLVVDATERRAYERELVAERDRARAATAALASSEAQLRLALVGASAGRWELDAATGVCLLSPESLAMHGLPADHGGTLAIAAWLRLVHPDDRDAVQAAADRTIATNEPYDVAFRVPRADGLRWVHGRGSIAGDTAGRARRIVGINLDVTERLEAQERERLLMREVDHRAKNLLAVVQSVVLLTRADSVPAFARAVTERVHALARAHRLLAESGWQGGDLHQLVTDELAPYAGDAADGADARVRIDGPALRLKPAAAQSVALVVHEFATNAAKHGALSTERGHLDVDWSLDRGEGRLHLRWRERNGPAVVPPTRRGFGSTLLAASIERQLGGTVRLDWAAEGLVAELTLPADEVADASGTAAPAHLTR